MSPTVSNRFETHFKKSDLVLRLPERLLSAHGSAYQMRTIMRYMASDRSDTPVSAMESRLLMRLRSLVCTKRFERG